MIENLALIGGDQVRQLLRPSQAVEAIRSALKAGLDPAADPSRMVVPTAHGQLLLMPAAGGDRAGAKVVTVAPGNADRDLPRIQGIYLLFDAATLTPLALVDGIALTNLRTPAVSIAAVLPFLRRRRNPVRVVVYGTGPQGIGHVQALADALAGRRELAEVVYVSRRPDSIETPNHGPVPVAVIAASNRYLPRVMREADIVVCATTAREPLFGSELISDRTIVIAVGSHEPDAREVDGALIARAHVVVEDVGTALREAGDIILAMGEGHATADDLIPLRRAVTQARAIPFDRPVLFKSTGMAWEDLVIAAELHRRYDVKG